MTVMSAREAAIRVGCRALHGAVRGSDRWRREITVVVDALLARPDLLRALATRSPTAGPSSCSPPTTHPSPREPK